MKKLAVIAALLLSSLMTFAAPFDGSSFEGVYTSVDPLGCKGAFGNYSNYRIKIEFTPAAAGNFSVVSMEIGASYEADPVTK